MFKDTQQPMAYTVMHTAIKEDNFGCGAAETDTIVLTYSTETTVRGRRRDSQFCFVTFYIDCGNRPQSMLPRVGTRTRRIQSLRHKYWYGTNPRATSPKAMIVRGISVRQTACGATAALRIPLGLAPLPFRHATPGLSMKDQES